RGEEQERGGGGQRPGHHRRPVRLRGTQERGQVPGHQQENEEPTPVDNDADAEKLAESKSVTHGSTSSRSPGWAADSRGPDLLTGWSTRRWASHVIVAER